ncbi:unnamed protein product [Schistosoma guineensis]|nr:unnamed protein product [Schistosoma guineensis]
MQWRARNQLEDLESIDDLAILAHTHEQMQMMITTVAAASVLVGLNIHEGKTKILKHNTENTNPVTLDEETLEKAETFKNLVNIIDERGGSDADVGARVDKARTAFLQLKNIWNSEQLSNNIEVRIFDTNV